MPILGAKVRLELREVRSGVVSVGAGHPNSNPPVSGGVSIVLATGGKGYEDKGLDHRI